MWLSCNADGFRRGWLFLLGCPKLAAMALLQVRFLCGGAADLQVSKPHRFGPDRCATEGQNTLLMGAANQNVNGDGASNFASTNDVQNIVAYQPNSNSTAYWWTDLSAQYNAT
jgi:hypothetical protein